MDAQMVGVSDSVEACVDDKYTSNLCPNCEQHTETVTHRYATCEWVASLWAWMADILGELDQGLLGEPLEDVLKFHFDKGLRDKAVTWLMATYVAFINQEVVISGRKVKVCELVGTLRVARASLRPETLVEMGPIPI